ncbi:Ubiquitin carboxyl-terminal hydrolase 2 [Neolecta irregularis DAH-3]|uniref:Ubiquitin carboxyl-terminal hydrolase n=1 Tax=Neolecta irregularis (strain DAH-3) TaxID=1198029 RepID=A0A1U7LGH5_NEOID|nr:Ubiquitin carboxyl-terminal hydrolase 2 [Neolecta irregularis DAH-3]|eukprot:OLL21631.1 Ubiquitin carboxyl-terminal hydrolase 2 [Neolecta irregularis DAH-3]
MSGWQLIESDPGVFTSLIESLGTKHVQVEELYSLDVAELGSLLPYGVIFLFKYVGSGKQEMFGRLDYDASHDMCFANQTINNACATQAILSVLLNRPEIELGPELLQFKEFSQHLPSEFRGEALKLIRSVHNSFARNEPWVNEDVKTATDDDDVFHFIAYLEHAGQLFELDGLREAPINHGTCSSFPEKVVQVIQQRINAYPANEIRFNLLAIVKDRRVHAQDIGDMALLQKEEERRRRWAKENELRKFNFLDLIITALKFEIDNIGIDNMIFKGTKRAKARRESGKPSVDGSER